MSPEKTKSAIKPREGLWVEEFLERLETYQAKAVWLSACAPLPRLWHEEYYRMIETSVKDVRVSMSLEYTYGGDIVLNTPRDNRKDSEDSVDDDISLYHRPCNS